MLLVTLLIADSLFFILTRSIFPYIDNLIYGKKRHSRPVPEWVDYRDQADDSA